MLNKGEGNYCITWQELLTIVRTLEHLLKYCYEYELHLCTDHSAMTGLVSFKNLEGETARWVQCLQNTASHLSIVRAVSTTTLMPFPEDHAEKSVLTAKK
jgi:hypothetical protein